jgi:thiol-disulfide isomerase/thioredoxin
MNYKTILFSTILLASIFDAKAQRKKVIYLDTLGNEIKWETHMSIRNTGRYKYIWDESNEKIRYIKPIPTTQEEFDSTFIATEARIAIKEKIGTKFNYTELVDINGKLYSMDHLKGKLIVINFWFVGCGPCEVEMPELNNLYKKFNNYPDVIFISYAKSKEAKIQRFLEKNDFWYPVIVLTDEQAQEFKIEAYPTNFLIDKNGVFIYASRGISPGAVHIMESKIIAALKN